MTTNIYLIKALEHYPYNLEECMESLNYALSYEESNPIAFCLLGRVNLEVFKDYASANRHFREALAADINYTETYFYFLECLLVQEDFEEIKKFIAFARKRKGIDQSILLFYEALMLERAFKFKKALKKIREAMLLAQTSSGMSDLEEMKRRVEKKVALK